MKKTLFTFFCLFLIIKAQAQLLEPILQDTMTLSQAKYALQKEMSTINYYFFQDYYGKYLGDRFEYYKEFRYEIDGFNILPKDSIKRLVETRKWTSKFYHTNRSDDSKITVDHNLDGQFLIKERKTTPIGFKRKYKVKKVFYSNGNETNPDILKTDKWYKNRKFIDSLLIDLTVYYPTGLKTISTNLDTINKKMGDDGAFVQVLKSSKEGFLDIMVSDNVVDNIAFIGMVSKDGTLYQSTYNTYTPEQPSTPMFSYANSCYMFCKQLVLNIDDGKYKSVKDLIKEFNLTRPIAPNIKWLYRYGFKEQENMDSIVFKYFTDYDSITIKNIISKTPFPRKSKYVIVEESNSKKVYRGIANEDGKWIIKPNENTLTIKEVAGIFYKTNDVVSTKTERLAFIDETRKQFVYPDYELAKNVNDTLLIVVYNDFYGVTDRDGKMTIPLKYLSLTYDKNWRMFVAKLNAETPSYQLLDTRGKPVLNKTFRDIHINRDALRTTEIINDTEVITIYDKNLKPIKYETNQDVEDTKEEPRYRKLIDITENLSTVDYHDNMGVQAKDGTIVIPVKYLAVIYDPQTNYISAINHNRRCHLFNTKGESVLNGEYTRIDFNNGYIYASKLIDNKEICSVYNKDLKKINPKNTSVESKFTAENEPILITKDNHQFFIDNKGKTVISNSNVYRYLDGFHSGVALATPRRFAPTNPIFGYIDPDGKIAIPFSYTKAYSFRNRYAYVEDKENAYFITTDNKIHLVLPTKAKHVYLADTPEDTRYRLENGDIYDGYANKIKE